MAGPPVNQSPDAVIAAGCLAVHLCRRSTRDQITGMQLPERSPARVRSTLSDRDSARAGYPDGRFSRYQRPHYRPPEEGSAHDAQARRWLRSRSLHACMPRYSAFQRPTARRGDRATTVAVQPTPRTLTSTGRRTRSIRSGSAGTMARAFDEIAILGIDGTPTRSSPRSGSGTIPSEWPWTSRRIRSASPKSAATQRRSRLALSSAGAACRSRRSTQATNTVAETFDIPPRRAPGSNHRSSDRHERSTDGERSSGWIAFDPRPVPLHIEIRRSGSGLHHPGRSNNDEHGSGCGAAPTASRPGSPPSSP